MNRKIHADFLFPVFCSCFCVFYSLYKSKNPFRHGQSVSSAIFQFVFHLQTGQGLQGRSSKGRERVGGNPQGHWGVWRKAVQQSAAVWCEKSRVKLWVYFFKWTYALIKTWGLLFNDDMTRKILNFMALCGENICWMVVMSIPNYLITTVSPHTGNVFLCVFPAIVP